MMRRSCLALSRGRAFLLALLLTTAPAVALAQTVSQVAPDTASQPEPSLAELRDRVEARYQVLPLRGGIALLPKYGDTDIQSREQSPGAISRKGPPGTPAPHQQ